MTTPKISDPKQYAALLDYAQRHGRTWKSQLNHAWMTGQYDAGDDSSALQQVRNTFGPSWLVKFKLPANPLRMSLDGATVEHNPDASTQELIAYSPKLVIENVQALKSGLGLKYLECIRSHKGSLIAKMWHRNLPRLAEIVVSFEVTK